MDDIEYDQVDMAELEANLYAQIHHDAPDTVEQFSAAQKLQQRDISNAPNPVRVVTNKTVVNNSTSSVALDSGQKRGRYWASAGTQTAAKPSHFSKPWNSNLSAQDKSNESIKTTVNAAPPSVQNQSANADYRPKPFTPYTSYLSQIGTTPLPLSATASSSVQKPPPAIADDSPTISRTHEELRAALLKKNRLDRKRKNRQKKRQELADRRPNPFNRIAETKLQNVNKLKCKQEKALTAASKALNKNIETIDLDSNDDLDDDDVICIPVPPPPLVCIESSDDDGEEDQPVENANSDEETGVTEDFIGQRDRTRISQCEDALGGLGDEELAFICATAEKAQMEFLAPAGLPATMESGTMSPTYAPTFTSPNNSDDNIILTTPKRLNANMSYEVSENGFAAVDIYESESSDFPESVYERGRPKEKLPAGETLIDSDSDVSDIEVNIANRLKRRLKRKSSGSNKGSDYRTCSEEEEDDNDDSDGDIRPSFDESIPSTSTPCVQRGDAVALSKSKLIRPPTGILKRKKRNKSTNEHPSDDEFVSMLSCIVHDDLNSTNDSSAEILSQDVIGARTIVEQTLKKSNRLQSTESVVKTKIPSKWVVTDEPIGHDEKTSENTARESSEENEDGEFMIVDSVGESDPLPKSLGDLTLERVADERMVDEGNDLKDDSDCVPSCSLVVDNPELCWNDEMRCFYNKSWGGERHNQTATIRSLPNNRSEWLICDDDIFPSTPQTSKRFNARNMRCNNCREKGHRAQDCYQPPKPVRCHMCGDGGHREPRCPNTICLRCGFKTNVFSRGCQRCLSMASMQCHQCKARGHGIKDCPDKWRRYHSTTKPNVPPQSVESVSKIKYCCVCASAGHLAEYCRHALRIMDNPAQPIKIQSYVETYQRLDNTEINPDGSQLDDVAPFAMVSVPQTHYNFAWDVNEQPERFYGRIMKATQLQRTLFKVISKKRKNSIQESGDRVSKASRKTRNTHKNVGTDMVLNPMSVVQNKSAKNNAFSETGRFKIGDVDSTQTTYNDSNFDEPESVLEQESIDADDGNQEVELLETKNASEPETKRDDEPTTDVATVNEPTEAIETQVEITPSKVISEEQFKETETSDADLNSHAVNNSDVDTEQPTGTDQNKSDGLINFSFTSALEEIEQQKQSSKTTAFELSFLQNKDTAVEETSDSPLFQERPKTPPPPIFSFAALSEHETHEICAEMQRLEKQEEMLNHLKHTIISTQRSKRMPERVSEGSEDAVGYHVELSEDFDETAATTENAHDSDSNYSFSDYFAKHQESSTSKKTTAREIVTFEDAVKMPDFIPLGQDEDDLTLNVMQDHTETPETSTQSIEKENPSKYSEAKIFLTKDHSKYLLTRNGGTFLTETYTKHNVIVRMEWRSIGNVLVVQGVPSAQDSFHADLIAYCTSAENDMRKKQEISQQVPKNRSTLIRFLKEQISQLEKPLAYAKEVFVRMKINEQQRSKTGTKNADKARKTLNMILFGQTGLRDGAMHLTALQSNLRCLIENETKEVISNVFRNEVFQHYKYIFSSFSHDNYADLVREYEKLRKNKQLPVLKLDRKLLGLKINVNQVAEPTPITVIAEIVEENTIQRNVASTSTSIRADPTAGKQSLGNLLPAVKLNPEASAKKSTDKIPITALIKAESIQVSELDNISEVGEMTNNHQGAPYDRSPDAMPSKIWSLKCSEYIEKCRAIPKISSNEKAMARLQQVDVKAKNGALSYTDFRMLMKIFDKCV